MHQPHRPILILFGLLAPFLLAFGISQESYADANATVSPMYQKLILLPGNVEKSSFSVSNPADSTENLEYELEIKPFFVDEEHQVVFSAQEDYSQIVDWIELSQTEGSLAPNEREEIVITINVPETAPAGGQYATIIVKTKTNGDMLINQVFAVSHLLYAEVAGETVRKGDIKSLEVPGFLFSGDLSVAATIENLGNVHSEATQVLRVFPLFSKEEYFTNEEDPQSNLIMPGSSRYTAITWDQTPAMGIFHVIYDVSFEGVSSTVDKIVIKCPLWLVLVIALIIMIIIIKIIFHKKEARN